MGAARGRSHRNHRVHPVALSRSRRCRRHSRIEARSRAHHSFGLRRGLRLEARPLGAGLCSAGGMADRPDRRHGLFAARIDRRDDQAPSRAHPFAHRREPRRPPRRHGFPGRFQYGRLCFLGADGGQPGAGPCLRPLCRTPLSRAQPRDIHSFDAGGRLSRLRRAANGDRPRAAARRTRAEDRHGPAGVSHPQRAHQRHPHRDWPGDGRRRGIQAMPRGATAALAPVPERGGDF